MNNKYLNFPYNSSTCPIDIVPLQIADSFTSLFKQLALVDKKYIESLENIMPRLEIIEKKSNPEICSIFDDKLNRIFQFVKPCDDEVIQEINSAMLEGISFNRVNGFGRNYLLNFCLRYYPDSKIDDKFIDEVYFGVWALAGLKYHCIKTDKSEIDIYKNILGLEDLVANKDTFHSKLTSQYALDVAKKHYMPRYDESYYCVTDNELKLINEVCDRVPRRDIILEYN